MDLGFFRRTPIRLWGWIIVPLVLIVVVPVSARLYRNHMHRDLVRRQELAQFVPSLEKQLERAKTISREFGSLPGQASVVDSITLALQETARETGLVVYSMKTTSGKPGKNTSVSQESFQISLLGSGNLTEILSFAHRVHRDQYTLSVEELAISLAQLQPAIRYQAEFTLQHKGVRL